jgi:hypothetical protein
VLYFLKYFGAILYKNRFILFLLAALNVSPVYRFFGSIDEQILTVLLFVGLLYGVSWIGKVFRRADALETNLAGEDDQRYRQEGRNRPIMRSHGH